MSPLERSSYEGNRMPSLWGVTAALLATLLAAAPASARTGLLDRDFGRRGLVRTDLAEGADAAAAVALLPDGRLLVAGRATGDAGSDLALVRYLPDGTRDLSFGDGGVVLGDFAGDDEAQALAIGPEGNIVAVGSTTGADGRREILVARYTADGAPDEGFAERGRLVLRIGDAGARARAVGVGVDGSVVVAGSAVRGGRERFCVLRLDPTGRLDPGFGEAGIALVEFEEGWGGAWALAMEQEGDLLVAGTVDADLAVARYDAGGRLDPDFGDDGLALVDVDGGRDVARAVAVRPDGRVLVAGTTARTGGSDFALVRLNARGRPDFAFGQAGILRTDLGGVESAHALAVLEDGGVVVAGQVKTDAGADLALVGHLADGRLDPGFGRGGRVRTDLQSRADSAAGLVVQPDGRLVVAGTRGEGASAEIALVRYRQGPSECGDGYVEGAEACDLGDANGASTSCCTALCAYREADEVCRPAAGACDRAEVCAGDSALCPLDEIAQADFLCRPAVGWCDLEERCSGRATECPPDRVRDRRAVCRSAVGPCDAAESCDGASPYCPSDEKSEDVCRPATGGCDLPERCDGVGDDCPADAWNENGDACYDGNPCTVDEICENGVCGAGTYEPLLCGAMLCNEGQATRIEGNAPPGVLIDGLENGDFRWAGKAAPRRSFWCAPASLTAEVGFGDPVADGAGEAPRGYRAQHQRLSIAVKPKKDQAVDPISRLVFRDRFGRRSFAVKNPKAKNARTLAVPAWIAGTGGFDGSGEYLKCYDLQNTPSVTRKRLPIWTEQGAPRLYDVNKLQRICVPVSLGSAPVVNSEATVACYTATPSSSEFRRPTPGKITVETPRETVWTLDSWKTKREHLCFPATVESPLLALPDVVPAVETADGTVARSRDGTARRVEKKDGGRRGRKPKRRRSARLEGSGRRHSLSGP